MSSFVEQAVSTILASIDEDTREYIASMIAEADDMEETREAVDAMIEGADEENAEELQKKLWAAIESSGEQTQQTSSDDAGEVTKLLEKKITIGDSDVQTFASGMKARGGDDDARGMDFSTFFANQIGIRTEAAMSEKKRRKLAQRKLREEAERREREIELENQMSLAATGDASADDAAGYNDSVDNAQDCHLVNFNLPNKKGSGTDLLSNVNLTLARGRRYGLVGRNGCGKTTLMEMISQRQVPGVPKNLSLLLVKQEIMGSDRTALETVIRSDTRREGLLAYIKKTEEEDDKAEGLAKAYERLSIMEEESGPSEPRARKVLSGLGFKEEMMVKPTSKLSGGWRMRVSLACALFASPNLLLLDEPTNHLDLEAVLWLERYLNKTFKGTLLIVSHDRHFLNEVVTDVLHFHRETLTCYKGDINTFEETREERRKNQIRLRDEQEAKRKHMQSYIDKHAEAGSNGPSAARQRKSRMKKMERIGMQGAAQGKKYKISYEGAVEDVEEYVEDEDVTLDFPDPGSFDSNIVELDRVTFGYEGAELLMKSVDLVVDNKSRVALLGRNGCGKSTLIKLIVGALQPMGGNAKLDGRAKIEYLAQHQLEQLDPYSCPLDSMKERYPGDGGLAHEQALRKYLAKFGLGGEVLPGQRIHTMSGGQKCRLCLAAAMYRQPHLLILDEPTNHLDLETTEALIEAIKVFKGGVLLVSHDQHLLTSCCKEMYVVQGGEVEKLSGGGMDGAAFAKYKKDVIAGRR
ncbi:hypothetical protein TrCOL_g9454 [Triparma columacea]|uniref:ABC transporter domain-containing protein n=1 Tax=Triparma columacea TaxID=722753 RepID=A0A9W7L7H1_9STRA|nr:hypothetical protein TrCOL_g9454 [Triparma columacea]